MLLSELVQRPRVSQAHEWITLPELSVELGIVWDHVLAAILEGAVEVEMATRHQHLLASREDALAHRLGRLVEQLTRKDDIVLILEALHILGLPREGHDVGGVELDGLLHVPTLRSLLRDRRKYRLQRGSAHLSGKADSAVHAAKLARLEEHLREELGEVVDELTAARSNLQAPRLLVGVVKRRLLEEERAQVVHLLAVVVALVLPRPAVGAVLGEEASVIVLEPPHTIRHLIWSHRDRSPAA